MDEFNMCDEAPAKISDEEFAVMWDALVTPDTDQE